MVPTPPICRPSSCQRQNSLPDVTSLALAQRVGRIETNASPSSCFVHIHLPSLESTLHASVLLRCREFGNMFVKGLRIHGVAILFYFRLADSNLHHTIFEFTRLPRG